MNKKRKTKKKGGRGEGEYLRVAIILLGARRVNRLNLSLMIWKQLNVASEDINVRLLVQGGSKIDEAQHSGDVDDDFVGVNLRAILTHDHAQL